MTSRGAVAALALILLVGACGSSEGDGASGELKGAQKFSTTYEVRADASRTAEVRVKGQVLGASSLENADAGEADVLIRSAGTIKITNTSKGRAIKRGALDHALSVKLPFEACALSPNFAETVNGRGITGGIVCSYNFLEIESPELDAGESVVLNFEDLGDGDEGVVSSAATSVAESDAAAWATAATDAVLVAGIDERSSLSRGDLNPTCTYPGSDGPVKRVTFWSSDPSIDECATEPDESG